MSERMSQRKPSRMTVAWKIGDHRGIRPGPIRIHGASSPVISSNAIPIAS